MSLFYSPKIIGSNYNPKVDRTSVTIDLNLYCRNRTNALYLLHESEQGYFTTESIFCKDVIQRFSLQNVQKDYHYCYDKEDVSIYDVLSALSFTFKRFVENNNIWGIIDCLKKQDALLHNSAASALISRSNAGAVFISPNMLFGIF